MLRSGEQNLTWTAKWWQQLAVDRLSLFKFTGIALQLGLLVLVIYQFEIENRALTHYIMPLTFGGFVVHHFLPGPYRLPFFLALSLAGLLAIFGLANGAWLIALGLALVGICHLPMAFAARVALLLLVTALLAFLRLDLVPVPWSTAIWPILGSMFMFRLIVYVYSLRHQKEKTDPVQALAYFFLLPNLVFPLFPVVDYNTFRRTYYNDDRYRIYQTGIEWLLRGVVQLILYRVVNYYLVLAPQEVATIPQFVQFLVSNFLLYLRVSGQFHLIVGLLHLFGFNLPETHFLYFLSSSFSDFWRRINIYWKDFMLNHFYYPTMFRVRQWGTITGTVVAIAVVFVFTWFFHAYQWFWLRGTLLLVWQDVLFWAILGLFVVANALVEIRYGRKRSLGKQTWTLARIALLALRTTATFTTICLLWSLWTSTSLAEWFLLLSVVQPTVASIGGLALALLALYALFFAVLLVMLKRDGNALEVKTHTQRPGFRFQTAALNAGLLFILFVVGDSRIYPRLGELPHLVLSEITQARLNRRDAALLEQGYYEDLTGINRFNSELWEVYSRQPQDWETLRDTEAVQLTNDFRAYELRPMLDMTFKGTHLTTNRWGMRDRDYEQVRPDNTYRFAWLGESHSMGSGVGDDETYENLLEDRLNAEMSDVTGVSYEILNFSVGGYTLPQKMMAMEKALTFGPDAVVYIAHQSEIGKVTRHISWALQTDTAIPYDHIAEAVAQAGIDADTPQAIMGNRLAPYRQLIIQESYHWMAEQIRAQGGRPLYILLSSTGANFDEQIAADLKAMAEEAGFLVLDLGKVYEGQNRFSLRIAESDTHPNAKGHAVVADYLYNILSEDESILTGRRWAQE